MECVEPQPDEGSPTRPARGDACGEDRQGYESEPARAEQESITRVAPEAVADACEQASDREGIGDGAEGVADFGVRPWGRVPEEDAPAWSGEEPRSGDEQRAAYPEDDEER